MRTLPRGGYLHTTVTLGTCRRCGDRPPRAAGQRWCKKCHATNMRRTRRRHSELSDEARRRANCRSYTNVLIRRGLLKRGSCAVCESSDVEAHHPDYADPRNIVWLCRPCHLQHHVVAA